MAQSGTNMDIEDVLASIRRAVRDGAAGARPDDRLVLTPALRIAPGDAPPSGGGAPDAAGGARRPPFLLVAPVVAGRTPSPGAPMQDGRAPDEAEPAAAPAAPDEAALRALVTDVVRRELEGPLGERITRNVRKLVRREVLAALAGREGGDGPPR
jgi:hypothetical protein